MAMIPVVPGVSQIHEMMLVDHRPHRQVAPFPAPARRTVHAVLWHTAHRRRSPPVFGLPRQSRKGLGATTVPDKSIRPMRFGD